jgi:hypothetical protein
VGKVRESASGGWGWISERWRRKIHKWGRLERATGGWVWVSEA